MKITMLETRRSSEDGFNIRRFEAGQTYDNIGDTVARSFIAKGWAFEPRMRTTNPEINDNRLVDEKTWQGFDRFQANPEYANSMYERLKNRRALKKEHDHEA